MQFLKKHYEKVLLSIVLLGLAAAAGALPLMVSQERGKVEATLGGLVKTKPKPWEHVNLTTNQEIVRRIEGPLNIKLSGEHNLFNPVRWIRLQNGVKMKVTRADQIGPGALQVTRIAPLHVMVRLDEVSTNSDKLQYKLSIIRETGDPNPRVQTGTAQVGQSQAYFTIVKVDGRPEAPTVLHVRLKDEKETIPVLKDKPYTQVIGHVADLVYPPDNNKPFPNKKKGDKLSLRGEESESYKVFDITENEVVISSDNRKKTVLKLNPSAPQ